jgi:hypothetical protein
MSDDFDMPPRPASFEKRGGWVVGALVEDFNLTPEQAAGIVGNLGFESIGFETLQERGQTPPKGGWGWAQWTSGRRRAFEAWCKDQAIDPASDEANYNYVYEELSGDYANVLIALRRRAALKDCVFTVGRLYETPAGTTPTHLPGFDGRLKYAQRALAGYQAGLSS